MARCTCYLQLEPTFRRDGSVKAARVVAVTQGRPHRARGSASTVLVKVVLNVEDSAFQPLTVQVEAGRGDVALLHAAVEPDDGFGI